MSSKSETARKHESEVWKSIALNLRAEAKRARDNAGLYPQAKEGILKSAEALEEAASSAMFASDKMLPLHVPLPDPSSEALLEAKDEEIRQLNAALAKIRKDLLDPNIVHTTMCRGLIAAPPPDQYFHAAYGEVGTTRWQKLVRLEKEDASRMTSVKEPTASELKKAKAAYDHYTDNHPTIHCNRFASWEEIGKVERFAWVQKIRNGETS